MLPANVLGNSILEQQNAMCPRTGTDGSSFRPFASKLGWQNVVILTAILGMGVPPSARPTSASNAKSQPQ
jgi:hypothetical protein